MSPVAAWQIVTVAPSSDAGSPIEIVQGRPAIAFVDAGELRFVRARDALGISWDAPLTVASATVYAVDVSLLVVNGAPAIAFTDPSGLSYVRATTPDGASWGPSMLLDHAWSESSMAIVNGNPAVAYERTELIAFVRALDPDGATWGSPVNVLPLAYPATEDAPSLAVVNGYPAISFWGYDPSLPSGCLLYLGASDADGATWASTLQAMECTPGTTVFQTSLHVVNGNPALVATILVRGFDQWVGYARAGDAAGTTWSGTRNLESWAGPANLAVVGGLPAVAYVTSGGELKYVRSVDPDGAAWPAPGTVDGSGNVGNHAALREVGGHAAIAYYDGTLRTFKFAIDVAPVSTDYVVGQGLAQPNPNRIRVYDRTGVASAIDFFAYGAGQWGVNVASGELNGSPFEEILAGPGPGPMLGPQVRGFLQDGSPITKVDFYAYGTLRSGLNVASGELDGDGFDEILSGAGPGSMFGPHVRGFDVDSGPPAAMPKVSFFAYGSLRWGVNVGRGDVDRDLFEEILTGPGPGPTFAATVRAFDYDGSVLGAMAKINFNAYTFSAGVRIAGGDVDDDGYAEMASAPGPAGTNTARFLGFQSDGGAVGAIPGFDILAYTTRYGGRVGLGDMTEDGGADLLAAPGPDAAAPASLQGHDFAGGALSPLPGTPFVAFPGAHGLNPAAGPLGF